MSENNGNSERQDLILGMLGMLNFLAAHPEIPLPANQFGNIRLRFWGFIDGAGKEQFIETAKAFGSFEKKVDGNDFQIIKSFGPAKLIVVIDRSEVCTKRTVMKTVPVDEWDCQPLLIDGKPIEEAVGEAVTV